jgi:hypothetical protein
VYTWGWNAFGQLGMGEVDDAHSIPLRNNGLHRLHVVQVAAGQFASAAVTADGEVPLTALSQHTPQCLMVRRWRLIGYFPILYNPTVPLTPSPSTPHTDNKSNGNTVRCFSTHGQLFSPRKLNHCLTL